MKQKVTVTTAEKDLQNTDVSLNGTYPWNSIYTNLLRSNEFSAWGNWSLNPNIKIGLTGILNPHTGTFDATGDTLPLGEEDIESLTRADLWKVQSDHMKQTSTNVDVTVAGGETEAGTKLSWTFGRKRSVLSKFVRSKDVSMLSPITLLENNMSWLKEQADDLGMTNHEGITQSFCVVTKVYYASSGLNVGAESEDTTFSLSGTVEGMTGMFTPSVSASAGYTSEEYTKTVDKHLCPVGPNATASYEVPVGFEVASFDGTIVMPKWTHKFEKLNLAVDNHYGGTYIADSTLTYEVDGEVIEETRSTWGGDTSHYLIPLNATNLQLKIDFEASGDVEYHFNWNNPLVQWPSGSRRIKMTGVWPWKPKAIDLEAS
ncbi:hypothetical protein [Kordia sp.]|uniref:hypothetical protein n=1 Tax=Kordia sp. TaxID=1965332 RepID=UPI003D6AF4A5